MFQFEFQFEVQFEVQIGFQFEVQIEFRLVCLEINEFSEFVCVLV